MKNLGKQEKGEEEEKREKGEKPEKGEKGEKKIKLRKDWDGEVQRELYRLRKELRKRDREVKDLREALAKERDFSHRKKKREIRKWESVVRGFEEEKERRRVKHKKRIKARDREEHIMRGPNMCPGRRRECQN